MIILPNTPPIPAQTHINADILSPQLSSKRASLASSASDTYNDLVRYVVSLEDYVEQLFSFISTTNNHTDLKSVIDIAGGVRITTDESIPWMNVKCMKDDRLANVSLSKKLNFRTSKGDWFLANEIELAVMATAMVYMRLGAELINELIEVEIGNDNTMEEMNEKWKQVITFYKKAISFTKFGTEINYMYSGSHHLNGSLFVFVEKISAISMQMSILSKSSWINRNSYNATESFKTNNNGTLCRVAIYVLDELKNCKGLLADIQGSEAYAVGLNTDNWTDYISIIEKYATAYAGLFLSIETYQQNKLGQAIGLLNFCLVNLQSKKISDISPKRTKLMVKFKSKLSSKKNEAYIRNLESITSLNLGSSLFNEKSGIILKDISYVFDQLIQLHLKFTKENDNLVFDKVTDYQDIQKDSKWPLGAGIPVTDIVTFLPQVFESSSKVLPRRAYY